MSESGPDFSFSIVAGAAVVSASAQPAAVPTPAPDVPTLELADEFVPPAAVETVYCLSPAPAEKPARRWLIWAAGGAAAGVLILLAVRAMLIPQTIVVNVNQPAAAHPPTTDGQRAKPAESGEAARQIAPPKTADQPKIAPAAPPAVDPAAKLAEAVYLVQVERSGRAWPFATCVAVGGDTLLTTAREAAQMAKWRDEQGFAIWVTRPAAGFKEQVRDIRLNGVYASLADKPDDGAFFNTALLTVGATLPKTVSLASPDELAAIEEGTPLACLGFTHEGEKITKFDRFQPQLTRGKVYIVAAPLESRRLPGQPRRLHFRAEMPKNAYGSPVVNEAGRLVGVYDDRAAELNNLHYVCVVNPDAVNLWLKNRDSKLWLPAAGAARKPPGKP